MHTSKLRSITPLSLLKFIAGSLGAFYFLLGVFFGVLGMSGCNTVRWNGEPVTGVWALPVSLLLCVFIWFGTTIFVWIALVVGFPLFRRFEQIDIEGEAAPEEPNKTPEPTPGSVTPHADA